MRTVLTHDLINSTRYNSVEFDIISQVLVAKTFCLPLATYRRTLVEIRLYSISHWELGGCTAVLSLRTSHSLGVCRHRRAVVSSVP
jgi:hypothetical protein